MSVGASQLSGQTQRTQVLDQMFGLGSPAPPPVSAPAAASHPAAEQSSSDDSASIIHPPPNYHFFGLTHTQTQSQTQTQKRPDDTLEHEGSQKENVPHDKEVERRAASPPPLTPDSPHQDTRQGGTASSGYAAFGATTRPEKMVSFRSPRPPAHRQNTRLPRSHTFPIPKSPHRPASPASQDSFAQDLIVEDPASAYLANNPQFNITTTQLQDDSDITNTMSWSYQLAPRSLPVIAHPVLPESQNSLSSQDQSQRNLNSEANHYFASQNAQVFMSQQYSSQIVPLADEVPEGKDMRHEIFGSDRPTHPSESSQPSDPIQTQATEEFLATQPIWQNADPYGLGVSGEATQEATQAATQEATQQDSYAQQPLVGTMLSVQPSALNSTSAVSYEAPSTTGQRAVRSLASTVPQRRDRLRRQGYAIPSSPPAQSADLPTRDQTFVTHEPEVVTTMPSKPSSRQRAEQNRKRPLSPDSLIERQHVSHRPSGSPPRKRLRAGSASDDLVPDSEPAGPDDVLIPSSLPEHDQDKSNEPVAAPEKQRTPVRSPARGDTTADIVPESVAISRPLEASSDDDMPVSILFKRPVIPAAAVFRGSIARTNSRSSVRAYSPSGDDDSRPPAPDSLPSLGADSKRPRLQPSNMRRSSSKNSSGLDDRDSYSPTVRGTPTAVDDDVSATENGAPDSPAQEDDAGPSTLSRSRSRRSTADKLTQAKSRGTKKTKTSSRPVRRQPVSTTSTSLSFSARRSSESLQGVDRVVSDKSMPRVFAYWHTDKHFYAGKIQYMVGKKYGVLFDDGTLATVTADDMRRFELHPGDEVRWDRKSLGRVLEMTQGKASETVRITAVVKGEVEYEDRPLAKIRIPYEVVETTWQDRLFDAHSAAETMAEAQEGTQSPSLRRSPTKRLAVTSVGSVGHDRLFAGTGFVLTGEKSDSFPKKLAAVGATVFDSWTSLYRLTGQSIQVDGKKAKSRWIGLRRSIEYCGKDDIERVFLISNQSNQTAKYLIALGLGIPCISRSWVEECLEKQVLLKWDQYILDAGTCTSLGDSTVTQQILREWYDDRHHMRGLPLRSSLLSGKNVLMIDEKCVPPARKQPKQVHTAMHDIPRIILAMGAMKVEAVQEADHALDELTAYDYVVLKDANSTHDDDDTRINYVPWAWLKDCLIANRLLPKPNDS